jgi:maltose alpha-D-glucosyltransferase/alpha-amylase
MIRLRMECPEIGWGEWRVVRTGRPEVLAMRYDWRGNAVLVVHNFSQTACEVLLRLDVDGGEHLSDLLAEEESRAGEDGRHRLTLEAFGYRWFRIGRLNYALRRARA